MMTGKQFNRAVRALTLVDEALSSLWLSAFFEWCRENDILTALKDKLSLVLASPHPKVYQLTQQSTTLYESLLTGEYEF
jgi:ferric-dicitrate binding protein FerR (iron transport regulator)